MSVLRVGSFWQMIWFTELPVKVSVCVCVNKMTKPGKVQLNSFHRFQAHSVRYFFPLVTSEVEQSEIELSWIEFIQCVFLTLILVSVLERTRRADWICEQYRYRWLMLLTKLKARRLCVILGLAKNWISKSFFYHAKAFSTNQMWPMKSQNHVWCHSMNQSWSADQSAPLVTAWLKHHDSMIKSLRATVHYDEIIKPQLIIKLSRCCNLVAPSKPFYILCSSSGYNKRRDGNKLTVGHLNKSLEFLFWKQVSWIEGGLVERISWRPTLLSNESRRLQITILDNHLQQLTGEYSLPNRPLITFIVFSLDRLSWSLFRVCSCIVSPSIHALEIQFDQQQRAMLSVRPKTEDTTNC